MNLTFPPQTLKEFEDATETMEIQTLETKLSQFEKAKHTGSWGIKRAIALKRELEIRNRADKSLPIVS